MLGLFRSKKPPTTPTPSPVTGATSAAPSPSFFNRVAKTLKGRPKPIPAPGNSHYPKNNNNIEAKEKIRERFNELHEEHTKSKDPRVKFLVDQLVINDAVFESLLMKDVISDNDLQLVKLFCNSLDRLFPILIADQKLATELQNYNNFLNFNYSMSLRETRRLKRQHARTASRTTTGSRAATATTSGTSAQHAEESPKDAKITDRAHKALLAMSSGLTDLPMMRANLEAKMARSKKQLRDAYSEFTKASKAANATTAALVTGMGNALNGSSSGASSAAGTGLNGITGLNLNLNEQTNAETQAVINQAVLASLPKFPQPPTTPPKMGGKRKTRSKKQRRNKTRKQRKATAAAAERARLEEALAQLRQEMAAMAAMAAEGRRKQRK